LMDGELSRSGAEEVCVHLESCLACRARSDGNWKSCRLR
jgi:anti-sigma factor RsiW